MPEVKEYDGKKAKKTTHKRRPHHDLEGGDEVNTEALNEGVAASTDATEAFTSDAGVKDSAAFTADSEEAKDEKVHLEFYGSDILRAKAPQAMNLADAVADQWVKDGSFQNLPIGGHPLAQVAASITLRKAKDLEKRLDEKGVFAMAKMGLEIVKSKLERKN
jgi:hypothetical protein